MPAQRSDIIVRYGSDTLFDDRWLSRLEGPWTLYPVAAPDDDTSNQVLFDSGVSMIVSIPVKSLRCELKMALESNSKAMKVAQESGSLEDVGALYLEKYRIEEELKNNPLQRKRLTIRLQQRHPIGDPFIWEGKKVTIGRVPKSSATDSTPCRSDKWDVTPMETL